MLYAVYGAGFESLFTNGRQTRKGLLDVVLLATEVRFLVNLSAMKVFVRVKHPEIQRLEQVS